MNYPVELRIPVLWGHMDAMGHVNNTVYFRFFESARVAYMSQMGLHARQIEDDLILPILASTRCDYKVPLTYPDEVLVRATTTKIGRTSFTQSYEIWSTAQNAVAAVGEGIIVCVDKKSGKPVEVPADMRAAIGKLEGRASG
jgi:acyl-CoA thioester hydrolase